MHKTVFLSPMHCNTAHSKAVVVITLVALLYIHQQIPVL